INVPISGVPTGVWKGPGGGSWSDPNAWNGVVPNAASNVANFGSLITSNSTVNLNGSTTVGKITFNNTNGYMIAQGSGGAITINDTGDPIAVQPLIDVQLGNHTIQAPVVLANGVTVNTLTGTSITMNGNVSGSGDLA